MNLFNCFQMVAFYTALPLLSHWLFTNQHNVLGSITVVVICIGLVLLSLAMYDGTRG